jgi:DNA-3-methyladenine glycosylase I
MNNNTRTRCPWGANNPLLREYHDREWGIPVHDEQKHFEFLTLEAMQAGLSWLIVLKKRENIRRAFNNFDYQTIAEYGEADIQRILAFPGVIRNRRKIEATIHNARMFLQIQREFGSFDNYIWRFVNYQPVINLWANINEVPVTTALSDRISHDLKKHSFQFLGSTTVYAHLQAIGIVNDHLISCFRYQELINAETEWRQLK